MRSVMVAGLCNKRARPPAYSKPAAATSCRTAQPVSTFGGEHGTIGDVTRPGNRRPSAQEARLAASLSGAVDLSGLKERAEARRQAPQQNTNTAAAGTANAGGSNTGAALPTSVAVDENNFENEVLRRSMQVPVIVELTSQRAPVAMTDTLRSLAATDGGRWVHATADVDNSPMIAQAFRAKSVPMVIIVAAGRPIGEFEGEQPAEVLRQLVDQVLQQVEGQLEGAPQASPAGDDAAGPADPERDQAESALANGDLVAAEAAFQQLVDTRTGDHSLLEALRFVQASRRVAEESDPAAQGHDETVTAALRQADISVVAGNYAAGFNTLIDLIRTSAGDTKNVLRSRLLELLDSLPPSDPEVLAARRNLATALY